MKVALLIFVSFVFSTTFVLANDLVIGCTYKCDVFFKRALKVTAKKFGIKIKILNISLDQDFKFEKVHGLIIPGGADINPELYFPYIEDPLREYTRDLDRYVNYTEEGKKRDAFEFPLLKRYYDDYESSNLPILGVCRGMQMLAVSQGIPLYVDIKRELGIRNRRYLFDRIHLTTGESVLNDLFGGSFWAFKRHHQGIRVSYFNENKSRWPDLEITAYSNRGLIAESLEFKSRPILGVQFHPENDFGNERRKIFSWLIEKAIERKDTIESRH